MRNPGSTKCFYKQDRSKHTKPANHENTRFHALAAKQLRQALSWIRRTPSTPRMFRHWGGWCRFHHTSSFTFFTLAFSAFAISMPHAILFACAFSMMSVIIRLRILRDRISLGFCPGNQNLAMGFSVGIQHYRTFQSTEVTRLHVITGSQRIMPIPRLWQASVSLQPTRHQTIPLDSWQPLL